MLLVSSAGRFALLECLKMLVSCHGSNHSYTPVFKQLAQLMADLQKMPGGAGFLKKQAGKQKTKEKSSVSR